MRELGRCEHCFHREADGPGGRIDGTARTTFRHVCCRCGESCYLAHAFDDAGNVVTEQPARGHLYAAHAGGSGCDRCEGCAGDPG